MRKISQTLTVVGVMLASTLAGSTGVSAQSTCPVGYTGPGSTNICTSIETYTCTVTNNNQVTIDNQNAQGSVSGDASGEDGAQTGTATNSNGAVFNFEITNEGVCTAVRTVAPTTSTPVQPRSSGKPVAVAPPVTTTPTVLAETSNGTTGVPFVVIAILGLAALGVRAVLLARK